MRQNFSPKFSVDIFDEILTKTDVLMKILIQTTEMHRIPTHQTEKNWFDEQNYFDEKFVLE